MKTTPVKLWRRQKEVSSQIGKKGKIIAWTIIRIPAKEFTSQAPYPVVIVALESKEKMILQLVDWTMADLKIGREIITVLRRLFTEDGGDGIIHYVIKCKSL